MPILKNKISKRIHFCSLVCALCSICGFTANAATIAASINGNPITDRDITARARIMNMKGQVSTDNRIRALSEIIDDHIKLHHAAQIQINPSDADVRRELDSLRARGLPIDTLDPVGAEMLRASTRAHIAWQMVIGRTIMPTVSITDADVRDELALLSRTRGLPVDTTLIRLVDIPEDIAAKLTTPKDCDDAMSQARNLGGVPVRITVPEFELAEDIRARIAGLAELTWSPRGEDRSVLIVCSRTQMAEFENLDEVVRQNVTFKRSLFLADQQLKQLRRRAVIVINNPSYRGALD